MDLKEKALKLHSEWKGKIEIVSRAPVATREDLSMAYTPGVAEPCMEIHNDVEKAY
ncbi:MAG TPA: NAD-dependent malic enzyme, partial [Clostridiaceae bacterium]|nr:NAD-dependent malic enzyme [Clostridiaceae bacterium]